MDFSISEQAFSFLVLCVLGFLTGIFFDLTRAVRIVLKTDKKATDALDILYLVLSAVFIIYILYRFNGLNLRIFHLIGAILGLTVYLNSVSSLFRRFFAVFIKFFIKILKIGLYPLSFLCKIVCVLFKRIKNILNFIFNMFKKVFIGIRISLSKAFKRTKKI